MTQLFSAPKMPSIPAPPPPPPPVPDINQAHQDSKKIDALSRKYKGATSTMTNGNKGDSQAQTGTVKLLGQTAPNI